MRLADDRCDVMLAMALEADVAQDDDLVIAVGLLEGALQKLDGIGVVAGEIFLIGARDPRRRALQAFAVGIIAGIFQQEPHRRLGLVAAGARAPRRCHGILVVHRPQAGRFRSHGMRFLEFKRIG